MSITVILTGIAVSSHNTYLTITTTASSFSDAVSRMPGQALPVVGESGKTMEYPAPLLGDTDTAGRFHSTGEDGDLPYPALLCRFK